MSIDQISLALSDPIRLRILDLLAEGRDEDCSSPDNPERPHDICARDILPELGIAPTRLSYHMKELREAGLVSEQKSGRWIYYSLNRSVLAEYIGTLQSRLLEVRPCGCCSPAVPIDQVETL